MAKIDIKDACKVLMMAYKDKMLIEDEIGKNIDIVLNGTHKTYKYILVTAILAKATNKNIDILSLQAGDRSKGAYDARSICHKVLVPFEREFLKDSLGSSNEPYLNKPARYKRLTTENPVKNGKDMDILKMVISILERITDSNIAKKYLCSALASMVNITQKNANKYSISIDSNEQNSNIQDILDFVNILIKKSCEGEICPLIVAAIESCIKKKYTIVPHKVNESGSSSKEIGDIDIYNENKELVTSIEVKDKDFAKNDVEHAIKKFANAKLKRTMFIYGDKVNFDIVDIHQEAARYGRLGYYCSVISIIDYVKLRLLDMPENVTRNSFAEMIMNYAEKINIKQETLAWIKEAIKQHDILANLDKV